MLMFLKQKQCGKIKGRPAVDEQNQRKGKKSDVTSTTEATELVLVTTSIGAIEGRDVVVIDAPTAFLTGDMDEDVLVI